MTLESPYNNVSFPGEFFFFGEQETGKGGKGRAGGGGKRG